jgi:hypothetical protein
LALPSGEKKRLSPRAISEHDERVPEKRRRIRFGVWREHIHELAS